MFCTNCGASNKDEAKLCINCSESLSEVHIEETLSRPSLFKKGLFLKEVNFLQPLFDFSFEQCVSLKIMKYLYGLSILWAGLIALFFAIVGFNVSKLFGIFMLFIGAPLIFLLMAIYSRVFLEMTLVIFHIADRLADPPSDVGMANTEDNQEAKDSIQWNV
jgi:hypothetical protein